MTFVTWPHWLASTLVRRVVLSLVLVLALIGLMYARDYWGYEVSVVPVRVQDFTQTVVASGQVENPHRIELGVQVTGTVSRVPVVEGQQVSAGEVLFELEATELSAALQQALYAHQQAKDRIKQIQGLDEPVAKQNWLLAQANAENAAEVVQRNRLLVAENFVALSVLDESIRSQQVAQAQLKVSQQQWASQQPLGLEMASAKTALALAQAAVDGARARLRYSVVRAPVTGVLIARNVELGDIVQPGKSLMTLSPQGQTQLVLEIDEKNLSKLKLGQHAKASADAYADQRFEATLVYVNTGIDPQRGSVEVKLLVLDPPPYLKQDMTVSVDIAVATSHNAKMIPVAAVHDIDQAKPWVFKLDHQRAVRQELSLGLKGGGWIEVVQGLNAGDQIVGEAALWLKNNARVRAKVVSP